MLGLVYDQETSRDGSMVVRALGHGWDWDGYDMMVTAKGPGVLLFLGIAFLLQCECAEFWSFGTIRFV